MNTIERLAFTFDVIKLACANERGGGSVISNNNRTKRGTKGEIERNEILSNLKL